VNVEKNKKKVLTKPFKCAIMIIEKRKGGKSYDKKILENV
jgi:hypothetical protein